MRILEEKLGKSAEHWKTDEKCQGKCRFESIVWSFLFVVVFFCLFVLSFFNMFAFLSPTRLKETNPDSTNDSIPDSNLHVSWLFFPMFSRFPKLLPSKSAFCSKVSSFFMFILCVQSILLSLCFPVVFMFFLFCLISFLFSVVFLDCFLNIYIYNSSFFPELPLLWAS